MWKIINIFPDIRVVLGEGEIPWIQDKKNK